MSMKLGAIFDAESRAEPNRSASTRGDLLVGEDRACDELSRILAKESLERGIRR